MRAILLAAAALPAIAIAQTTPAPTSVTAAPAASASPAAESKRTPAPPPSAVVSDPAAPRGRLPDAATPIAYRLSLTVDPEQPRFSGHDEIDVTVRRATRRLYLHGRDLDVTSAVATVGGRRIAARFWQVDNTGTARLDFAEPLPAGQATLAFDYSGAFGDNASGLYRIRVDGRYYSWTQFESIDARAAFPSFDEPGFKTPFTVSVTTRAGNTVVGNAPEARVTALGGGMERHDFAPTRPLPTYLVALMTGPFLRTTGQVPATPQRAEPLPLGIVATQAQKGRLDYALAESQPIVALLERYFGQPFPFPKLDQIGSPVMPGAMENAGADTYGDGILLLGKDATTRDRQTFGMVVSHELSHQWFGDLVTPAWWDDIWLNESFANWMGFRIGGEWRPELNIGVGGLAEGFAAMNTDALEVGRPIHQRIDDNSQIDSAFDSITYGKGGQVIAMVAAYLGDEKFRDGVRLHLSRHMYGNATSEQFFTALADAAKDPGVVAAMKSFVDQPGVPVVTFSRAGGRLVAAQARYAYLGSRPRTERWTIPLCYRVDAAKTCTLLATPSRAVGAAPATGVLMPNVGGTGYYRFDLPRADWDRLIAASATLGPAEAIAATDSLWASFRAGKAPATALIAQAKAMAANPDSNAAVDAGERLESLHARGFMAAADEPAYDRLVTSLYAPRLQAVGADVRAGAYPDEAPDRQKLRQSLIGLLVGADPDGALARSLEAAATRFVGGDRKAIDPALLPTGLALLVHRGGVPAAKRLVDYGLASEDPLIRQGSLGAAAASRRTDVGSYLLGLETDPRLRTFDKVTIVQVLAASPGTIEQAGDWVLANYARLAQGNGIFFASRMPSVLGSQCSVAAADRIEQVLGPSVRRAGAGLLAYQRVVESIRHCGVLKERRGAEMGAAILAG